MLRCISPFDREAIRATRQYIYERPTVRRQRQPTEVNFSLEIAQDFLVEDCRTRVSSPPQIY